MPQLLSLCSRAKELQLLKPFTLESRPLQLESSPGSPHLEKISCRNKDPAQSKLIFFKSISSVAPHLLEHISELHIVYLTLHGLVSNYTTPLTALDPHPMLHIQLMSKGLHLPAYTGCLMHKHSCYSPSRQTMATFSPTHSSCD